MPSRRTRSVGQGRVILTTPPYLLDRDNRALPLLDHLLTHLTSGLLPVRVSPGVECLVSKTQDGWVVGLISNRGVYKQAIGPPDIRPEESVSVAVRLEGVATSVEEWLTAAKLEPQVAEGATTVTLTVPAGDVRVLHFTSAAGQ